MKIIPNRNIINVLDMKEGEIGTITKWADSKEYIGLEVIRKGENLVEKDNPEEYWGAIFRKPLQFNIWKDCFIKLD